MSEETVEPAKTGRNSPKGPMSEATKERISDATRGRSRSEAFKASRSEAMKKFWADMSPEEKARRKAVMNEKFRDASKNGSRVEKEIVKEFLKHNIVVELHPLVKDLEVDLFLPQYRVVIEVDGPSHHMVLFSEEALEKTRNSDDKKNRLIASYGFQVIRTRFFRNRISIGAIREFVRKVKDNLPTLIKRTSKEVLYYDLEDLSLVSQARVSMFDQELLNERNNLT